MASSVGLFVRTDGSGNITALKEHTDWDELNAIIPGNFGGPSQTDFLLYLRSRGVALFLSTDGSGNVATIKQHTNWDRDWDVIVSGNFGGGPHSDLFLYKRSSGVALFLSSGSLRPGGSGSVVTIREHADWDRDWDVIVPGNFAGGPHSDLFLYKRSSGVALFLSTDGSGNVATIREHADWDRDWDVIAPGNFAGGPHSDLFLYKRSGGVASFLSTDGSGNVATIREHADWDRDWDVIVPGDFGGGPHSDLLLYKRSRGIGLFLSTDGSGNVVTIKQHTNWDKVWDAIIPGNSGGSGRTGLLFYSKKPTRPPNRPTDLKVTDIAAGQIGVSWTDQSNNEDGFRVRFVGKREGLGDHTGAKPLPANSKSAILTELLHKHEYTISVVALNAAGESPSSNSVVAVTPNVPQALSLRLHRQQIVRGFPPYSNKYPEFGFVPPGRLLGIRMPETGLVGDTFLAFVKGGHTTEECGDPTALVIVREGERTKPEQIKAIYGVPEPSYSSIKPIPFVACLEVPGATFPPFVDIEITVMD